MVPEKSIGSSFNGEPLSKHGFWADRPPLWILADPPWHIDAVEGRSHHQSLTDAKSIAMAGVMSTPGISVDGKLVHAGGLPEAVKL